MRAFQPDGQTVDVGTGFAAVVGHPVDEIGRRVTVNVIGTTDAFNQAKFYASANFNLSSVLVVAILFVIITIPQTRFVDWMLERSLEKRKRG